MWTDNQTDEQVVEAVRLGRAYIGNDKVISYDPYGGWTITEATTPNGMPLFAQNVEIRDVDLTDVDRIEMQLERLNCKFVTVELLPELPEGWVQVRDGNGESFGQASDILKALVGVDYDPEAEEIDDYDDDGEPITSGVDPTEAMWRSLRSFPENAEAIEVRKAALGTILESDDGKWLVCEFCRNSGIEYRACPNDGDWLSANFNDEYTEGFATAKEALAAAMAFVEEAKCEVKYDIRAIAKQFDRLFAWDIECVDETPREWGHGTEAGYIGHADELASIVGWFGQAGNTGYPVVAINNNDIQIAGEALAALESAKSIRDIEAALTASGVRFETKC